jgi:hypothetical protein
MVVMRETFLLELFAMRQKEEKKRNENKQKKALKQAKK